MKKLLLSSIVLLLFSFSILIFQISCQKTLEAQTGGGSSSYTLPPATTSTLGGIIVGNGLSITSAGVLSVNSSSSAQLNLLIYYKVIGTTYEVWTANYDGTNQTKVNIVLPVGTEFSDHFTPKLSPDGTKVFFALRTPAAGNGADVYSCNINGTNVTKIIDKGGSGNFIFLGGAY